MSEITDAADRLEAWLEYGQNALVIPAEEIRTVIAAARGARSEREWYDLRAERDALAAVIEKATTLLADHGCQAGDARAEDAIDALASVDTASILREHDARVLRERADSDQARMFSVGVRLGGTRRTLLSISVADWLRAEADRIGAGS